MTDRRVLTFADHLGSVGGTEAAQLAIFRVLAARGWDVDLFYQSLGDYWPSWHAFVWRRLKLRVRFRRGLHRCRPPWGHSDPSVPVFGIGRRSSMCTTPAMYPSLSPSVGWSARPWWPIFMCRPLSINHDGSMPSSGGPRRLLCPPTTPPFAGRNGLAFMRTAFRPSRLASISSGSTHVTSRSARRSGPPSASVRPEDMILYVGRVQRIKGVHFLLEAVRRLPTPAKVVVCGAATEPGYEEELMQAGGNTVFLGRRSDIPELMAAADLLVMPSDMPETQGLVIHESMACGTPVVASDVGGLTASMAGFPNQLVKPGDAVALSGVIERFLHWRHDDPGLGERSRKWVSCAFVDWNDRRFRTLDPQCAAVDQRRGSHSGSAGLRPSLDRHL